MILLLGSTGYVGSVFAKYFNQNKISYTSASVRFPLNVQKFQEAIIRTGSRAVFNCAGFTGSPNVDSCELAENKIPTLQANALLPKQIAKVCSDLGVKFVHISSGCIYTDPQCDNAKAPTIQFDEDSISNFGFNVAKGSWYSGTKALGEDLIKSPSNTLITRLRIPFNGDISHRNYISKVINYNVLLNSTNSFSHLDEFVRATYELYNQDHCGIFNLTQPGYLNTKEVVEILKKYGLLRDKSYFKDIEAFEKITVAPRSNCVLNSSKALRCGIKLTHVAAAFEQAAFDYSRHV